jgi:DNA-binding CsgD family transcriptional regulator
MDQLERLALREAIAALPPAERRLARLLMAGMTRRGLKRRLSLDERTIRRHFARLRRRLRAFRPGAAFPPSGVSCLKRIGFRNSASERELEKS